MRAYSSHPATDANARANPQANNFDALRFLLAVCVIFSHSFDLMGRSTPVSALFARSGLGREAVMGFFILSGYLITMSWLRSKSPGEYLKRRALRIYPGFIVVCLLTGLVAGPFCSYSPAWYWSHFSPSDFIAHIATLRLIAAPPAITPVGEFNINGSLWTIHEEFLCYLIVALLGLTALFQRRGAILALFLGVFAASLAETHFGLNFPLQGSEEFTRLLPLLAAFLLGSCFYLFQDKIAYRLWAGAICLAGAGALLRRTDSDSLLCLPLEAYALFAFAFAPQIRLHRFAQQGDFSYGLYLYAMPIQCLLIRHFALYLNGWTVFLLTTPLTLCCAVLSWRFVEKPFLRRKEKQALAGNAEALRRDSQLAAPSGG